MKKGFVGLALILLSVCFITNVFAAGIQPYASMLINSTSISLNRTGTTLTAEVNITTKVVADKLGFDYIRIQVKQGTKWVAVKSATSEYKYNGLTHSYTLTYTGTAGNEYRAVAGYYAEDEGTSETRSGTSSTCGL